jgi:tetratricopeptide (TPR) repeat protein
MKTYDSNSSVISFFPSSDKRLLIFYSLGIFSLAFLVRLMVLLQLNSSIPFFHAPVLDELYNDTWAQRIAAGEWIGTVPFFRAPLYTYFLAVLYSIFGHSMFIARLAQIVLGSLSCVLIFLIARRFFNLFIGVLSGVVASLYAMLVFHDVQLLSTSLEIFLNLVLIYMLIRTADKPRLMSWLYCGIILGFSAITRPNILVFIPTILIWMLYLFKSKLPSRKILMHWLFLCLGVLLLIVPVTLRNYLVEKDLVFISWQGGYNFYLGNNPNSDGWSATAPQFEETLEGGIQDAARLAEGETGSRLKPSQVSGFWYRKGIHYVLSKPGSWLNLMVRKTIYFWKGYELSNTQNIYVFKDYSSIFNILLGKHIIYIPFGLLGPLSLVGLGICLKNLKKYLLLYLFIFSYMASVVMFFSCARFRMPVIPFLIMFASFYVWWLYQKIKAKSVVSILLSLIVAGGLMSILNTRLESLTGDQRSTDHFTLGWSYRQMGKINQAIDEWETSLKYNPRLNQVRTDLASAYFDLGLTDRAEKEYKTALVEDTSYHDACYYGLGLVFSRRGDLDSAIEYYSKSLEVNPQNESSHLMLGHVYYNKGWYDKAKEEWEKVLEINPKNQEALKLLGKK